MKLQNQATQEPTNHQRQSLFCIKQSFISEEKKKKQSFLSKLSFDYSLIKINKEKMIGQIIPLTAKMYPNLYSEGSKILNYQYSSAKVRQSRRKFLSTKDRYIQPHKQQIKRYTNILQKKKQQGGGLDSFWFFKKKIVQEERKKAKLNQQVAQQTNSTTQKQENPKSKRQHAYVRILSWCKQPTDIENSLISKNMIKNYLTHIFGQMFALRFIGKFQVIEDFYELKSYINFKEFDSIAQKFANLSVRQAHLINFFLYDENGDGFICPKDVFAIFQRQLSAKIQRDVNRITQFVRQNDGIDLQNQSQQRFKIQNVVIRDDWLTIKDYQMFFKKLDEPYLKATNKKDTVFSKSFAVIDHRQKIRSTRKQMTQKKNMYNALFGAITRMKKNVAYVQDNDYRLNYTTLYHIFGQEKTELFKFFVNFFFGI